MPDQIQDRLKIDNYTKSGDQSNIMTKSVGNSTPQRSIISIDKTGEGISTWINPDPSSGDQNIYHVQHSYEMLKKLEAMRDSNGVPASEEIEKEAEIINE